jgi:hypothetical protein
MLRNPDTIPAGDTLIEDPAMEPYFITQSSTGGFTVYERVNRGKNDKAYLRTVCYPSTFNYALKAVSKELMTFNEKKHYKTVQEYLNTWDSIEKSMKSIANIGR